MQTPASPSQTRIPQISPQQQAARVEQAGMVATVIQTPPLLHPIRMEQMAAPAVQEGTPLRRLVQQSLLRTRLPL